MATLNDLPAAVQASNASLQAVWNYAKSINDETLKGLVATHHHTLSAALNDACEVFEVERDWLLPPPEEAARSGPDDKPEV